jgi:2-oxoglutarate dehydrogenase E2 component (dihydrolipoamide succinyltransferase)
MAISGRELGEPMTMQIKVPTFPESVADGTIATWHKHPGENVERDELIVDIETDKVVLEIVAPADGSLAEIIKKEGDTVLSEEVIAIFDESAARKAEPAEAEVPTTAVAAPPVSSTATTAPASPAARKLAEEHGVDLGAVGGTGRNGRITKEDVRRVVTARESEAPEAEPEPMPRAPEAPESEAEALPSAHEAPVTRPTPEPLAGERPERRVPMTRLRASIARRLVEAQHNAAMLTTFNEVNMEAVIALRRKYQDLFERTHEGTRLGFMSFFVRASVEALKRFPSVNASIDENDIVYHGYYDIGVATTTERGLVVPVIRDADGLSLAQIEERIRDFATKARDNKLTLEEMSGGTFTISNGGVFGSLLSTPILNPPQTAILGMHKIEPRPVVEEGEIVVRSRMYLALSYDHRLIDGSEAVRFLVTIKELLEDPARILLEI